MGVQCAMYVPYGRCTNDKCYIYFKTECNRKMQKKLGETTSHGVTLQRQTVYDRFFLYFFFEIKFYALTYSFQCCCVSCFACRFSGICFGVMPGKLIALRSTSDIKFMAPERCFLFILISFNNKKIVVLSLSSSLSLSRSVLVFPNATKTSSSIGNAVRRVKTYIT